MSNAILTFVVHHKGNFVRRETLTRSLVRIGRDPGSHLHLADDAVSPRHAVIEVAGPDTITIVDLAGKMRTAVNGAWVEEARIGVGDRILLGHSEIVLEQVVLVGAPLPHKAAPIVASEPWSPPGFSLGADLRAEDAELAHVLSAEVTIAWGENVLHVAHLSAEQSFYVGDDPNLPSDFLVPREKLGTARLPLVLGGGAEVRLVIPAHAQGFIEGSEGVRISLEQARAYGTALEQLPGACWLALALGTRAQLQFGDIVFRVAAVLAGKPFPHGLVSGFDASTLAYLGLSALSVGGFLSSIAFLAPPLGLSDEADMDPDRLYLLQQYLESAAVRERELTPKDPGPDAVDSAPSGAQAAGEEGALGRPDPIQAPGRVAIKGQVERDEQQLSREAALNRATTDYMIGLLNTGLAGDPDAPTAPWGAELALGSDERSARGDLWSAGIGDIMGPGGLGVSGTGLSGGGKSHGIGLNEIGTVGSGDQGMLSRRGPSTRGHATGVPRIRPVDTQISGRIPPQTIRRIVQQNHSRFRSCYEKGLLNNPTLEGRVGVRFVIGRDGSVSNVSNAGSDLPDPAVVNCVSRAFYDIGFPKPEGGIVTVVYPIVFQAD
jgi:hypothetical protein